MDSQGVETPEITPAETLATWLADVGDILPFEFMPDDRTAVDWPMVRRVDEDGDEIIPTYRAGAQTNG